MTELNVAMIGYQFMGKAHSNAWRQVGHFFDLPLNPVVSGMLQTFVAERPLPGSLTMAPVDVDDAALALLRFENGALGSLEATRFATGRKNHNRFEINGEKGSLSFNLERLNELELYLEEGKDSGFRTILVTEPKHPYVGAWWPPGHVIGYEHSFTHTVLDLVRAGGKSGATHAEFRGWRA